MRFFTPDLLHRFGAEDDTSAFAAHQALEERSEEYLRHLRAIAKKLPSRLLYLLEHFYLHDSRLIAHSTFDISEPVENGAAPEPAQGAKLGTEQCVRSSFWMVLQLDTPPHEILVLQYHHVLIEYACTVQSLVDGECPYLEWLYDEVELIPSDRNSETRHSILFTKGLELRLRFRDFDFATLDPISATGQPIAAANLINFASRMRDINRISDAAAAIRQALATDEHV